MESCAEDIFGSVLIKLRSVCGRDAVFIQFGEHTHSCTVDMGHSELLLPMYKVDLYKGCHMNIL